MKIKNNKEGLREDYKWFKLGQSEMKTKNESCKVKKST